MAVICREMKWDYHTYLDQPTWLIDMLTQMLHAEAIASRKASQRRT